MVKPLNIHCCLLLLYTVLLTLLSHTNRITVRDASISALQNELTQSQEETVIAKTEATAAIAAAADTTARMTQEHAEQTAVAVAEAVAVATANCPNHDDAAKERRCVH